MNRKSEDPRRAPDPFTQALTVVVLAACLYMAIPGLVYMSFIAALIPPGADFSLPNNGSECTQACQYAHAIK